MLYCCCVIVVTSMLTLGFQFYKAGLLHTGVYRHCNTAHLLQEEIMFKIRALRQHLAQGYIEKSPEKMHKHKPRSIGC